jgi:glycosyltransferase involved in cell wall biosynthesis
MRIALMMQGNGTSWIGGTEYIRNLVVSCGNLPQEERSDIELCLIFDEPFDSQNLPDLTRYLGRTYQFPRDLPPPALPPPERPPLPSRRIAGLLSRFRKPTPPAKPSTQSNAQMADFLARERIDFLYPVIFHRYQLPIGQTLGACRWAGWLPDFQHRHLPQYFDPNVLTRREAGLSTFFNDARTIVFSSHNAASDYKRFYPAATARAEVLHFHTFPPDSWYGGDPLKVQSKFHLPDKFVLVSNQLWQHKNHLELFKALALLSSARSHDLPHVVCTGYPADERNPNHINHCLRAVHELGLAQHVSILGLIERAEQIQLLRRCIAVVQPSLFEGWSTIVEDARVFGKEILMSDIAVHKEQNPPNGLYFEHASARSLADCLDEIWKTGVPGPDIERETDARTKAIENARAYARSFLSLARRTS